MKITLLLPIWINPDRPVSDLDRFLSIGLPSLHRFVASELIHELLLIAPAENLPQVKKAFQKHCHFPFRVLDEKQLCPSIADVRGWHKQQIIKFAAAQFIETAWYLTLDADVVCVRPIDETFLFPDGKAIWQREPAGYHMEWWQGSLKVLGSSRQISEDQPVMGVTPVLYHTASVLGLILHISQRYPGEDWTITLLKAQHHWDEHSLYWIYLLDRGETETHYSSSSRILYDCQGSVWLGKQLGDLNPGRLKDLFDSDAQHGFMVFQSNLGLPLAIPVQLLRPWLGGSAHLSLPERWRWQTHFLRFLARKSMRRVTNIGRTPPHRHKSNASNGQPKSKVA